VFGVREEGLTVSSIRRCKGGGFLAVVLPGCCAWQGGLIGNQLPNHSHAANSSQIQHHDDSRRTGRDAGRSVAR
jgi:hypothetical protein